MPRPSSRRASGEPGANEEARSQSEELDKPIEVELPEEKPTHFRTPRFMRMRFNWASDEERRVIEHARQAIDQVIQTEFYDAYLVMNQIYDIVRFPLLDEHDQPRRDPHGFILWEVEASGVPKEDFTRMTRAQKEHFIGLLTTRLFAWEQRAANLWTEAMFAKAQFEERFAIAYDAPMSGTVDDRKARGNMDAAEERYFAIFKTSLSRRADSIVRSMDRLSQRLKDTLTS